MKDRLVKVLFNKAIAKEIYHMRIESPDSFPEVIKGGQFIHIALPDLTKPLRRPFCIAEFNIKRRTIDIVYAIVGEGTQGLSKIEKGSQIKALFPLGNGFTLPDKASKIVLLGGGMGSAVLPAIPTAEGNVEYHTFLGFASKDKTVLVKELTAKSKSIHIATDDGSLGAKGYVTTLLASKIGDIAPDAVFCCGPEVMYKSLARELAGCGVPIFISLEKRMGCGVGACLVCNCKIRTASGDKFLRACVDGPVFNLCEVVL